MTYDDADGDARVLQPKKRKKARVLLGIAFFPHSLNWSFWIAEHCVFLFWIFGDFQLLYCWWKLYYQRIWTREELAMYNGTDDGLPILLGILGCVSFSLFLVMIYLLLNYLISLELSVRYFCKYRSVFDVTKGRSHYGPGGGYNHFAGRFVTFDTHYIWLDHPLHMNDAAPLCGLLS